MRRMTKRFCLRVGLVAVGLFAGAPFMPPSAAEDPLPAMLKGNFPTFQTPLPASAEAWAARRTELRRRLWELFGDLPPRVTPQVKVTGVESRVGYTVERFTFPNGVGDTVFGYVLVPEGRTGRGPAILYNHYHGGRYQQGKEELFLPAFADGGHKLHTGEELVRAGYVVLAIDAYAFGERQFHGPGGSEDQSNQTEQSLFKMFLWQGRSLWGMMVRDDIMALDYLVTRPEVDPGRIAAMGMSMGSTRTWWLAALDERIKVAVAVACLTRYQDLIAGGKLHCHGIYYFVPGMLKEKIDTESVVGLIAPRALLTLTGDQDDGSPAHGVRTINRFQEQLYRLYGKPENFRGVLYPGLGHEYTPEMWQETLEWLKRHL